MKTDRFSDSIRRKLESIRPDFSDKDWKRMQATLQQATLPPSGSPTAYQPFAVSRWSARPWLMTAAAVSLVVLVSYAAWQRAQIADLRQTVSQLRQQQTTRPRQAPPETAAPNALPLSLDTQAAQRGEPTANPLNQSTNRSANPATISRLDTVYVTRYMPVPAQPASPTLDQTAQRPAEAPTPPVDRADRGRLLTDAQTQQGQTTSSATTDQRNDLTGNTLPAASGTINERTNGVTNGAGNRPGTVASTRRTNEKLAVQPTSQPENDVVGSRNRQSGTATIDNGVASDNPTTAVTDGPTGEIAPGESGQLTTVNALTTRPVTRGVINWSEALAQQAKRIRPARTTTVGGQSTPVNQPASQPVNPVAFGFRIGAGAEVSRTVLGGGLLTELLIGNHLTLGIGYGISSFAGGTFTTDVDFDRHKPKKFRYDYARGIDPRSDIVNIGTHTVRVQIPVSLGYRIPVSQSLSLLPSAGTTLSLQSKEFVTFTYRQPLRSFETVTRRIPRPVDLLNNLTFGAGVEWHRNHWVGQAGPVLTVPIIADANWQGSTSLGLRVRLFYQF